MNRYIFTKPNLHNLKSCLLLLGFEIDDACLTINYCINDGFGRGMWKLIAPNCVPKNKLKG